MTQYSFSEFTSKIFGQVLLDQAPAKAAVGLPGDRIEEDLVGERELPLRIPATDVLAMGSCGLSEPIVEEASARAADPVEDAVEDPPALLVLVEAEPQEVVHEASTAARRRTQ